MFFVKELSKYNFRSLADGQSHHSFSNHSQRDYLNSAFPSNLVNSRPGKYTKNTKINPSWVCCLCLLSFKQSFVNHVSLWRHNLIGCQEHLMPHQCMDLHIVLHQVQGEEDHGQDLGIILMAHTSIHIDQEAGRINTEY